jgi:lipopolysaccharide transport system permease protein
MIQRETTLAPLIEVEAKKVHQEYLHDLFRFRDLFLFFAARDILVRYRQAFFGIAWALIRPLLTMGVFALIFGKVANLPSGQVSYSLFVLSGMIAWQMYANSTQDTCNVLLNNALLITKTYFPRMIIPMSQLLVHLVDFGISLLFFFILLLFYGFPSGAALWLFPFFILLLIALCLGTGLWASALTVQYRDFKILVPFAVQFGMFLSPVGYGTFLIPEKLQYIYLLNPLVGIIDGFRWTLLGITYPLLSLSIASSILITFILLLSGFYYFRGMERTFADKL